jgi:hypothetical protein
MDKTQTTRKLTKDEITKVFRVSPREYATAAPTMERAIQGR